MLARPVLRRPGPWLAVLLALAAAACTSASQPAASSAPAGAAPAAAGARPDLNAPFLAPDVDVQHWVDAFEAESREIAAQRDAIAATLQLTPGMAVADVGAGTGLFMDPFAAAVGPHGVVYAVDIAPKFIDHMQERAQHKGLNQVHTLLCTDHSTLLPDASVDAVFVCDTYHHFEYPQDTLASIRRALRPGGRLVVVDFERVPGQSRDWVLGHVRAGKQEVRAEIEAAGFTLEDEPTPPGLHENYVLRFRRR